MAKQTQMKSRKTGNTISNFMGNESKNLQNTGRKIRRTYTKATNGLQAVGKQMARNVQAGQNSPRANQANYSINPLKGTRAAFTSAFKK